MRTALLRLADSFDGDFGPRRSMVVLLLILLAVGFCSTLHSISTAFWYDEVCTVIICRLPSAPAIWNALENAADGNPPAYFLAARLARQLIPDDHLGYRLPSILGMLATLLFVYLILSGRVDRLSALVGAAFVLCTMAAGYATEARPYALLLAAVSGAILAWQRIAGSMLNSIFLAIALAAAISMHYYAILVWPAFALAEASVWLFYRRFRVGVWAALLAGALPLAFTARLLASQRAYLGENFWAHPNLSQVFSAPGNLFRSGEAWGFSFAVGVAVLLASWCLGKAAGRETAGHETPADRKVQDGSFPVSEGILTLVLLGLPVIAVAAAIIAHGGMTDRYMMPTVLGGALAVGYLTSKARGAVRLLLLILMLMNYGSSAVNDLNRLFQGSLLDPRAEAASEVEQILTENRESDLPIVVSDGIRYLPMAFYTPAESRRNLFAVVDARAALAYADTDSVDLGLVVLQQYFPLQVVDYDSFAAGHREFLLVSGGRGESNGGRFDWWPARLARDGNTVRLLFQGGPTAIYRVTLKP